MENQYGTRTASETTTHGVSAARAIATDTTAESAVAWGAIFAGAFAAVSISIILASLGTGFGLAAVSTQTETNPSPMTFGIGAAIWTIVVQWVSAGVGGYIAGRLRTKWTNLHTDEVFFRDTAHGFLAWAAATLFVIVVASTGGASALKGAAGAVSSVASGIAQTVGSNADNSAATVQAGPFIQGLFRSANPASISDQDARSAAGTVLGDAVRNGGKISDDDRNYLVQLVSAKSGISQSDAQQRVDAVFNQMKEAASHVLQTAEATRKAAASTAIIGGLSLLIGAFIGSASGALGGRLRDAH